MRGRWQAALVTASTAFLSLWLPPLLIVSGAALALPTLRRGAAEGALVLVMAALGVGGLFLLTLGSAAPVQHSLLFWTPAWLLAMVLRLTVSLAWALQAAAAVGGLAVLAFMLAVGDSNAWWLGLLEKLWLGLVETGAIADPTLKSQFLDAFAPLGPVIPGIFVASLLFSVICGLLLGRWWQALLYNPGGFKGEFHELRLGQPLAVATVAMLAIALFSDLSLVENLLWVVRIIYVLQGIALVHGLVAKAGLSVAWLVVFYLLLPFLSQLVMLAAVIDAWVDFRGRIAPRV